MHTNIQVAEIITIVFIKDQASTITLLFETWYLQLETWRIRYVNWTVYFSHDTSTTLLNTLTYYVLLSLFAYWLV